jgi:hypothetical protein
MEGAQLANLRINVESELRKLFLPQPTADELPKVNGDKVPMVRMFRRIFSFEDCFRAWCVTLKGEDAVSGFDEEVGNRFVV